MNRADEQLASWIGAQAWAFEFFQGTPKLVVPDNGSGAIRQILHAAAGGNCLARISRLQVKIVFTP
jgi:transposase